MSRIPALPQGVGGETGAALVAAVNIRTLLVKVSALGNNIADNATIYAGGTASRVVGVLRLPITSPLTVRINRITGGVSNPLIVCGIPSATAVGSPVAFSLFTNNPQPLLDGDVLTFDILGSDGQADPNGVAAFTLQWS